MSPEAHRVSPFFRLRQNTEEQMKLSYFPPAAAAYIVFLTAVLGLVFGSFCNAWAWRIVHHERISRGRSHCTSCGHTLGVRDLVPLFSWLFLHGRCRYCGAPVSRRYPLTELLCCVYFLSIVLRFGIGICTLRFLILGALLLAASLVDYDTMELPDGLVAAAAVCALLRLIEDPGAWKNMLWGLAVPAALLVLVLVMDKVLGRESMGGGDIKLIAALSLHFGPAQTLLLLILACFIGLIAAAMAKKGKLKPFPFGPSISFAAWLTALAGGPLVGWYLSLF